MVVSQGGHNVVVSQGGQRVVVVVGSNSGHGGHTVGHSQGSSAREPPKVGGIWGMVHIQRSAGTHILWASKNNWPAGHCIWEAATFSVRHSQKAWGSSVLRHMRVLISWVVRQPGRPALGIMFRSMGTAEAAARRAATMAMNTKGEED